MIQAYQMTELKKPFEKTEFPFPALENGDSLVQIAGCGVCHTDISFWHHGVPTKHPMPLILGHEISGIVIDGPQELIGKSVIIPAVLPCGECELCQAGRSNICQFQKMPGNDFHGGFASHIVVPSQFLAQVPDSALATHSLADLAVIADAVSTPYQVIKKSELQPGQLAVIIGTGGIGIYAVQVAKIFGAKVIAIDISQEKLDNAGNIGADATLNSNGLDIRTIKGKVKGLCKELSAPKNQWKIFEMSGTKPGQELAFALLGIAGTLSIVGFTMAKLELRLSNLMAFDAKIIGTWGCKPELYADVVDLVSQKKLILKSFIEHFPMSQINQVFQNTLDHKYSKRSVLIPDF